MLARVCIARNPQTKNKLQNQIKTTLKQKLIKRCETKFINALQQIYIKNLKIKNHKTKVQN